MNNVRLLVSVRNDTEAIAALRGGADIIDAKEPDNGSLGACDEKTIATIANAIQGTKPFSVACGELMAFKSKGADPDAAAAADADPAAVALHGSSSHVHEAIQFRKFGLAGAAGSDWHPIASSFATKEHGGELVIVAYADFARVCAPAPQEVMAWVVQQSNVNLLIDTAVKDGTSLFDWMSEQAIAALIETSRSHGKLIGLAGALKHGAFHRAAMLRPDIVGVRGAACVSGERTAAISTSLVQALVEEIATVNATRSTPAVNQSVLVEG